MCGAGPRRPRGARSWPDRSQPVATKVPDPKRCISPLQARRVAMAVLTSKMPAGAARGRKLQQSPPERGECNV